MKLYALFGVALLPITTFASTIAIIDSGTDYKHKDLAPQYEINAKETPANKVDDDQNGYVDDTHGWNIVESNASVIDYSYLPRLKPLMPEIKKFFEIQVRLLDKTATEEDKAWMKAKREDKNFIKELGVFGNFSHGSHVAGITAGHSTQVEPSLRPFAIKLIPTEIKLPFSVQYANSGEFQELVSGANTGIPAPLRLLGLELGLRFLAKFQTKIFGTVGKYVHDRKADIANGSFGTSSAQIRTIVEMLYNLLFKENERDPAHVDELARGYMQQVLIHARSMPLAAPGTLFVFAAGNDGTDNSVNPVSPANLSEDNTITVAATLRNRELASFSNYGSKVHVAAPGVGILSLYPGDDHGLMSGTSQAAPYVAGVAALVKNENPNLTPKQIKEILMGTVDTKPWLMGKVSTSGIVNAQRAREAGRLSKDMSIYEAVTASFSRVADQPIEEAPTSTGFGLVSEEDQELAGVQPLISPIH